MTNNITNNYILPDNFTIDEKTLFTTYMNEYNDIYSLFPESIKYGLSSLFSPVCLSVTLLLSSVFRFEKPAHCYLSFQTQIRQNIYLHITQGNNSALFAKVLPYSMSYIFSFFGKDIFLLNNIWKNGKPTVEYSPLPKNVPHLDFCQRFPVCPCKTKQFSDSSFIPCLFSRQDMFCP